MCLKSPSYYISTSMLSHLLLHNLVMICLVRHDDEAFNFKQYSIVLSISERNASAYAILAGPASSRFCKPGRPTAMTTVGLTKTGADAPSQGRASTLAGTHG